MWAYENENITDKGTEALLNGISQLKDLDKLAGKCAVKIQVLESFLKGSLDDLKNQRKT